MNSTSQSPGQKLSLGSGPNALNNKTLIATLVACTSVGLLFVLLLYVALTGRNPSARLGYGIFVSLLPALGAYVVLRLTNVFVAWWGAVVVYFSLFVLIAIFQAYAR